MIAMRVVVGPLGKRGVVKRVYEHRFRGREDRGIGHRTAFVVFGRRGMLVDAA